ncbi:hypothetical protein Tam1G_0467 [Bifidobacterium imperatoris]|uniref:Uncharacterized protein n=1 Tax=Bifidobacterium imperatoris TaxID=2020965 RepID=A0A2N5IUK0_9BIFI|nr:hypothetical protein Tam1G_0467 [Bifidobacterium imperatoris]
MDQLGHRVDVDVKERFNMRGEQSQLTRMLQGAQTRFIIPVY